MAHDRYSDDALTPFTHGERAAQLADAHDRAALVAAALDESGQNTEATQYREWADAANEASPDDDLTALAEAFPSAPAWLNARAIDRSSKLEPWQQQVAKLRGAAASAALELRRKGRPPRRRLPGRLGR